MDKQDIPDDSPPAYDDEVVQPASTSIRDPFPPPYQLLEPQLFSPSAVSQFPPPAGQPAIPYTPPDVCYLGLPQQRIQQQQQPQQQVII